MFKSVILIVIISLFVFSVWTEARPEPGCRPCPRDGCIIPSDCPHGAMIDYCGRTICAKGPGERCKIRRFQTTGNCGEGMYCHCGVCMGCSLFNYECFEATCIIPLA